jgi:cation diffusion facilitator family transporter
MSTLKFRVGRRIQSSSLVADAWNDTVDILSAAAALVALALTIYNPSKFLAADHYGGFTVGIVVIVTGVRVLRDTSLDLTDTMPDRDAMERIREVAWSVPGVLGVEKCFARKTGLQYHVDLHLEFDPRMTVQQSHDIATTVRFEIKKKLIGWQMCSSTWSRLLKQARACLPSMRISSRMKRLPVTTVRDLQLQTIDEEAVQ